MVRTLDFVPFLAEILPFILHVASANMRYSITFLGLIATASGVPTAVDPCATTLQCLLAPLASEPAAAKFCALKYPSTSNTVVSEGSAAEIKSSNP